MITAYPTAGKAKSLEICAAFVAGCGGAVATGSPRLLSGPAAFYGIDSSNEHLWREAREDLGRAWYYIDNAFFDATRGTHFRIAKNRLQHHGEGTSDCSRFRSLGIEIKPWRAAGDYVVVCPQSDHFMRVVVGYNGDWLGNQKETLPRMVDKPLRVRVWNRDKGKAAATLGADLDHAYALVTWSSAAAVNAVMAGVPVVVGADCAAGPMSTRLQDLADEPQTPEREQWAGVLADNQWNLQEFRDGTAWRALQ